MMRVDFVEGREEVGAYTTLTAPWLSPFDKTTPTDDIKREKPPRKKKYIYNIK